MIYEDLPSVHRVRGLAISGTLITAAGALLLIGAWSWWAIAGGWVLYLGGCLRGGAAGIESVARSIVNAANRDRTDGR